MGLDMYLKASVYVGGWDRCDEVQKARYRDLVRMAGLPDTFACPGSPHAEIVLCVAYWRKANAIHRWFVENVQGGSDECQESSVSREQLAELVALCKQVLATVETVPGECYAGESWESDGNGGSIHKVLTRPGEKVAQSGLAASLLPTTSGFFFGCTDYDDGYLSDLRDAIAQIEPFLGESCKDFDFTYRASW